VHKNNLILIKTGARFSIDRNLILSCGEKTLKKYGYEDGVELSIRFVGVKKAKELNLKYRKMDYIPQVLGFPMSRDVDSDGYIRLGDIVICTKKLMREVDYQKSDLKTVLQSWIDHGLENLLKG
jgi:rRNA maturation RNase YbeY